MGETVPRPRREKISFFPAQLPPFVPARTPPDSTSHREDNSIDPRTSDHIYHLSLRSKSHIDINNHAFKEP